MEVIDRDGSVLGRIIPGGVVQTSAHEDAGTLVVTPHPISLQGQRLVPAMVVAGETLADFLARHDARVTAGDWVVSINGFEVPALMWGRTYPKPGTLIECRRIVRGDILKIGALLVLSYFTFGLGGLGAGGLFASGGLIGGGFLAAAAAFVAGSLLINQLLGPKQPDAGRINDNKTSATYTLAGGNNQSRPYEPLGLLFGELRIKPDFSSVPYTWFEGPSQVLYEVLHGGINCASVSALRIGSTPLESYSDWSTQAEGFTGMPNVPLIGWGNVDTIPGAKLTGGPFLNDWQDYSPGPWVVRTTSANTVVIQVDLEGTIYHVADDGSIDERFADIEGEFRLLPSGDWTPLFRFTYRNHSTDSLRYSHSFFVASGQYDVRFRKNTTDKSSTSESILFAWSALKSVQNDTGYYAGVGRVGLKIKATGQVNGTLDTINWMATAAPVPCWNGAVWYTATTSGEGLSNPGANILQYARGYYGTDGRLLAGMGLPDESIDFESLQGFMVHCFAHGFRFDWWLDQSMSHGDVLDSIAAAGMGSIAWPRGKLGVVWYAEDEPIGGVVNMTTMQGGNFQVDYLTSETADGIEYQYFDAAQDYTWQSLRVVDPTTDTSLNPATVRSVGVTHADHGAILARFHLAQSLYQRKSITFDTDLEHLTYQRGSVLALTHDMTQWGYGGRLTGISETAGVVTLIVDDILPEGSNGYVGLRMLGERAYRIFPTVPLSAPGRALSLAAPWPLDVIFPGEGDTEVHDTLWIYDFKSTPGYKVRVTSIQPKPNMDGATVTCVPEGPEFWNYILRGTYQPAPNSSRLAARTIITRIDVTEQLVRQGNTFAVVLTLVIDVDGLFDHAEIWGALDGGELQKQGETNTRRFVLTAGLDDSWHFEARPFDTFKRLGIAGVADHVVDGLRTPPSDVPWIDMEGDVLTWGTVNDVDLAGYVIRYHYGYNRSWGDANPLHDGILTTMPYTPQSTPQGQITLMIRAIDTTGNLSVNTAYLQTGFGDILVANVVQEIDFQATGFPGTRINSDVIAGFLQAAGTVSFYRDPVADFYPPTNGGQFYAEQYSAMSYETVEFTAPAFATGAQMTFDVDLDGGARTIEYRSFDGGAFYAFDNTDVFFSSDNASRYYPEPPQYQAWPGSIAVRGLRYQFRVSIAQGADQGRISACKVVVDVPDINESFSLLTVPAAGLRLPIQKKYIAITNVQLTLHSDSGVAMQAKWIDKDSILGPLVQCLSSANVPTSGTVDARIQGY